MSNNEDAYECERCGCTIPEEVTGGWRCSRCEYQPAECTCYELTGGHQPGCAFNRARGDGPKLRDLLLEQPERPARKKVSDGK